MCNRRQTATPVLLLRGALYLAILGVSAALLSSPAAAMGVATHRQIVRDAQKLCPEALQAFLQRNLDAILAGSDMPDTFLKNWFEQQYVPAAGAGGAPQKAREELEKLVKLLSDTAAPENKAASKLGSLAHYLVDVYSAAGVLQGVTDLQRAHDQADWDALVTAAVSSGRGYPVRYRGFRELADVEAEVRAAAEWSAAHLNDPDFRSEAYDRAVNAVVNAWISAWKRAGRTLAEAEVAARVQVTIRQAAPPKPTPAPTAQPSLAELAEQVRKERRERGVEEYGTFSADPEGGSSGAPSSGATFPLYSTGDESVDARLIMESQLGDISKTLVVLGKWTTELDESGTHMRIRGEVSNMAAAPARKVLVRISGVDKDGSLVVLEKALCDPPDIPHRGVATFDVVIDVNPDITDIKADKVLLENEEK
ncbi:MAG: zinc dependent phospholipase C family protein [Candidatus Schekmanbacteria bacterium]|nr:zinc dependent phospholipase C family protein [Candidatus Schekmanbacteria bacterium]